GTASRRARTIANSTAARRAGTSLSSELVGARTGIRPWLARRPRVYEGVQQEGGPASGSGRPARTRGGPFFPAGRGGGARAGDRHVRDLRAVRPAHRGRAAGGPAGRGDLHPLCREGLTVIGVDRHHTQTRTRRAA